jgi:tetratricopeptide (TPR) repeat protein
MKKILIAIPLVIIAVFEVTLAEDNQSLWKQAADYYDQGSYSAAIEAYNKMLDRGFSSPELYYNLGNSYFKSNQLGRAIWSYRRALRLNPGFKQASDNLQIARTYNADQISIQKRGFILDFWDSLTGLFSANGYLVLFALFWWVAGLLAAWRIVRLNGSSWPYYLLIVVVILAIFSATSAARREKEDHLTQWGVISQQAVDIREGPGADFKKIEVGHEGLEFRILGTRENSCLIELGNGLRGWVDKQAVLEI